MTSAGRARPFRDWHLARLRGVAAVRSPDSGVRALRGPYRTLSAVFDPCNCFLIVGPRHV